MTLFFTSDQHYGHERLISIADRPFLDANDMAEVMISRHNRKVKKGYMVYHLGDFCWGRTRVEKYLARLNGTHVLISGNHDRTHPMHKRWQREVRYYLHSGFREVHTLLRLDLPCIGKLLLCHFPPYMRRS